MEMESPCLSTDVDTTKDPCQKVKCSRNKVCIAQGYQRAVCVNRKKLEHRLKQPALRSPEGGCQPCPISSSGPVCGSDGHNYASQCKLEQQACLTGKELTMKCSGLCPCPTTETEVKHESCTGQDLSDLGDRLRDWFQLLQGNAKLNNNSKTGASNTAGANSGSAINLDKYEVCIRSFFNSCDSYRDGKVSTAEWCLCFWRESLFIPSCNEDGYYRKLQCDQARGECWCVDQQGGELASSRIHGNPDCDEAVAYSGDFGSGVGWEDEEDKEAEENAEEEEGEVGEADDEGYIW
ncbi:unnamed protein product [Coregonus sp. 'balchen']|nr:unnamed protein product [Coregonus sp. 'balchen']